MTKNILFFIVAAFGINTCFGQDVIKRTRKITSNVTEKYSAVIGADREIKQGLYQALYKKKWALASGKYADDKRIGIWHFFNRDGQLIENYNYDTATLQYEAPEDSTSKFDYVFDNMPSAKDVLTKPIKPGGRYFGYVNYLKCFELPHDINEIDHNEYKVMLELLISPGGRLAEFKIHLASAWEENERIINVNINRLKEDDKMFIPATLNNEPISSRIAIYCRILSNGTIDIN